MNINDFNRRIFFQMFTQFRNIYIHASGIEIIIVSPNILQSIISFKHFINIHTQQFQQLRFFGRQFLFFFSVKQGLFLGIKCELPNFENLLFVFRLQSR